MSFRLLEMKIRHGVSLPTAQASLPRESIDRSIVSPGPICISRCSLTRVVDCGIEKPRVRARTHAQHDPCLAGIFQSTRINESQLGWIAISL
jgi:hypothetical protein